MKKKRKPRNNICGNSTDHVADVIDRLSQDTVEWAEIMLYLAENHCCKCYPKRCILHAKTKRIKLCNLHLLIASKTDRKRVLTGINYEKT